jgi:hypothetical protein
MDIEALPQQSSVTNPVTITVREVRVEEEAYQIRRQRPFRTMIEPVTQFRKRKLAPSQPSSPPPKRNTSVRGTSTMTHDHGCPAAIASDESPSKDHKRRRTSVAAKVVDSLIKLMRKDSHQVGPPMSERRRISPGQDEYPEAAALGLLSFANVSGFFKDSGETGPSNYYETHRWEEFHNPKEGNSKRAKSRPRRSSSPELSEARMADVYIPYRSVQETTFPASGSLESTPRRADLFRIKTKRMSKKARGKQPDLSPKRELPQASPAVIRGGNEQRYTTLPLTFDALRSTTGSLSVASSSKYPQRSSPKRNKSEFFSPSPEPPEIFNQDDARSFPITRQPRPIRPHIHRILTGRPNTDEHSLDAKEYSDLSHLQGSTPSPGQATSRASAFTNLFGNRFHLSPPHDPSPNATPTPREPNLLTTNPRQYTRHPNRPNRPFMPNFIPTNRPPSRGSISLHTADEDVEDDSTMPLLTRNSAALDSRSNTPTAYHIFSRTSSNHELMFPMSPCGSRVDLNEQTGGLELRRMRGRGVLEGVSVERGFVGMEGDGHADDKSDEEIMGRVWFATVS